MIDPCIYKVFKQDKKVFIPEFGAIIFSEASQSLDFNDLLTFDDGKVIEEIQKKHKVSEDEAREKLEEHVSNIKTKLEEGKSHFIRGLGYLFKNEQGDYAIQKNKPTTPPPPVIDEEPKDSELPSTAVDEEQLNPEDDEITDEPIAKEEKSGSLTEEESSQEEIEPDLIVGSDLDEQNDHFEEESFDHDTKFELLDDEDRPEEDEQPNGNQSVLAEEDEDLQDYYKRKDEYYSEEKPKRSYAGILVAVAVIIIVGTGLFYYFNYYSNDQQITTNNPNENSITTESKESTEAENTVVNPGDVENKPETTNEDESLIQSRVSQEDIEPETIDSDARNITSDYSSTGNDKLYSLILGSFQVESNANRYQEHLTNRGLDVSIFRRGGSFHFVGYEEIAGKSNAVRLLAEARENQPSAWIIRKKEL